MKLRQGDVLLVKCEKVKGIKKDNVLAIGEVTGHKHVITGQATVLIHEGQQFLDVKGKTELVHEEHDTLEIPEGFYAVKLQREYDVVQGVRQVMD